METKGDNRVVQIRGHWFGYYDEQKVEHCNTHNIAFRLGGKAGCEAAVAAYSKLVFEPTGHSAELSDVQGQQTTAIQCSLR